MKELKVGESYQAEELAEICGQDESERYGHYAFVGERATVIALDEGNDVVKVVHIVRQTPQCPNCHKDIDTIYTSRTVHLTLVNDKWVEEQVDRYCTYGCPECGEEFSPQELDKLGVPEEIR
ncbi:unnamed protein product, partial [marine sediment metagenome]